MLDLGCGNGYLAGLIAQRGYAVTGVERAGCYDPAQVPANVTLVEGDLEREIPVKGVFNAILCADILEHLRSPEALLRQIVPLLAPDGRLICSLPNSGHLYFRLVVLSGRFPQEDKGLFDRTHVRFYTWEGWRDLLENAGFRIAATLPTGVPVSLAFPRSPLAPLGEKLSYTLARAWPTMFAYQFVVEALRKPR